MEVADEDAMRRILACHLHAVDELRVIGQQRQQDRDFVDVVLPVAVSVEDEILGGVIETAAQRRAIATID